MESELAARDSTLATKTDIHALELKLEERAGKSERRFRPCGAI